MENCMAPVLALLPAVITLGIFAATLALRPGRLVR
jgi:hypothetical protein